MRRWNRPGIGYGATTTKHYKSHHNAPMFEYNPDNTVPTENGHETLTFDYPIIVENTRKALSQFPPLMADDYRDFKRDFLSWLSLRGKSPKRGEGYATSTVRSTHYKIDRIFSWLWAWDEIDDYTTDLTPEHAERLLENLLAHPEYSDTDISTYLKSIKRLYKYFNHVKGFNYELDVELELEPDTAVKYHDYFYKHEMRQLYEAALKHGSFKSYHSPNMSSEERDRLTAHLAQRFEKPKSEITPADFDRANSWKFPSLLSVSLDVGFRPVEISRARTEWFNLDENLLMIPKDESSKTDAPWECALSDRTATVMRKWLDERSHYEKYHGREEPWLTKFENPYSANSLNKLLQEHLLPKTNISPNGRDLTWYSIRRGVATVWANEEGLHEAKEQLRHKKIKTTLRYVHSEPARRSRQANSKW